MKKFLRISSVIVLAAMLSTLLCSCAQLDDLKSRHAVYTKDDKSEIEFRGNTYRKITLKGEAITGAEDWNAFVTKPDVPVLIAASYGENIGFTRGEEKPVIIKTSDYDYSDGENIYYCLDEKYDYIKNVSDNAEFDSMYVSYFVYPENYYDPDVVETFHCELVDKDVQEAVLRTSTGELTDAITSDKLPYAEIITMNKCDKDLMLCDTSSCYSIYKTDNNEFYVNTNATAYTDQFGYLELLNPAGKKDSKIFAKLFEKYKDTDLIDYN